ERVDSAADQFAKRFVHQTLPLDPRLAGEGGAFDYQPEMGFARRIVTAVAAMLLAVVDQRQSGRIERCFEPAAHFSGNRSSASVVHLALYREVEASRKHGKQGGKMAWAI